MGFSSISSSTEVRIEKQEVSNEEFYLPHSLLLTKYFVAIGNLRCGDAGAKEIETTGCDAARAGSVRGFYANHERAGKGHTQGLVG